jgi:hypothetical protein
MKKLSYFLPITLFILFSFNLNTYGQNSSIFDLAPNFVPPADTIPPVGFPLTPKWHFDYSANTTLNGGTVGAIFFQGNFYLNRWNAGPCYLLPPDANWMPDPTAIVTIPNPSPYLGNIRDMTIAPDNSGTEFLWGSDASSTLRKFDAGMNQIATYATGGSFRAIAFDPVTGGFWSGNFAGAVTCYDTTGALVGTSANGSALAGKYGMAFTSSSVFPGANSLWIWDQTPIQLVQIDVATDAVIATYIWTAGTYGPPGGAEVCIINNEYVLLLNYQNSALGCYFIAAVPVELTSFTAIANGNNVVLDWSTATETNNQGFEVLRSHNGVIETVGYVAGFGTTTEPKSYSFVDDNLEPGIYSYRLKQIDFDGTFELHMATQVEVFSPAEFVLEQNYPNPFNPSTTINFSLATDSKVSLTVFDVLGQEVANLISGNLAAGSHEMDFNASNINSGVYLYRIDATGVDGTKFSSVKKMILTK